MTNLQVTPAQERKEAGAFRLFTLAVCITILLGLVHTNAFAQTPTGIGGLGMSPYAIGLWGDLPYSAAQKTVGVPNLIADMNSQNLSFTAHDGDLKAGSGPCPNSLYTDALVMFNSLNAPAVFTPGDNDWTDCDRDPGEDSLERLDYERSVLFSTPYTLGGHPFLQEAQQITGNVLDGDLSDDTYCLGKAGPRDCVENRRWTVGRVTYATLNIQGSCNNLCDVNPDPAEYAARNKADIQWMQETFASAKANGSVAVMFISQGDPAFDRNTALSANGGIADHTRNPTTLVEDGADPDGYHDFLVALRTAVIDFERPVAYVHGDTHYFRVDKPFLTSTGFRLENFTRVETPGSHAAQGLNDVQWLKVYVDPNSREVFSYQLQLVPGNRVAVPAP